MVARGRIFPSSFYINNQAAQSFTALVLLEWATRRGTTRGTLKLSRCSPCSHLAWAVVGVASFGGIRRKR